MMDMDLFSTKLVHSWQNSLFIACYRHSFYSFVFVIFFKVELLDQYPLFNIFPVGTPKALAVDIDAAPCLMACKFRSINACKGKLLN